MASQYGWLRSPFETLGVGRYATKAELTKARRLIARNLHPDVAAGDTTARMQEINIAHDAAAAIRKREGWCTDPAVRRQARQTQQPPSVPVPLVRTKEDKARVRGYLQQMQAATTQEAFIDVLIEWLGHGPGMNHADSLKIWKLGRALGLKMPHEAEKPKRPRNQQPTNAISITVEDAEVATFLFEELF